MNHSTSESIKANLSWTYLDTLFLQDHGCIFYIQLFIWTEIWNFKVIFEFFFNALYVRKKRTLILIDSRFVDKVLSLLWIRLIVLPSLKYRKPKFLQPIVILIEKIAWGFRTKENGRTGTKGELYESPFKSSEVA